MNIRILLVRGRGVMCVDILCQIYIRSICEKTQRVKQHLHSQQWSTSATLSCCTALQCATFRGSFVVDSGTRSSCPMRESKTGSKEHSATRPLCCAFHTPTYPGYCMRRDINSVHAKTANSPEAGLKRTPVLRSEKFRSAKPSAALELVRPYFF